MVLALEGAGRDDVRDDGPDGGQLIDGGLENDFMEKIANSSPRSEVDRDDDRLSTNFDPSVDRVFHRG